MTRVRRVTLRTGDITGHSGKDLLEPYVLKGTRAVLRREWGGNISFLSEKLIA